MRDVPLGTLIFRAGLLAEEQLEDALQEGMRTGKRLGEVLAARGLIKDTELGRLLAGQQGLPYVDALTLSVDPAALARLPEHIARMQNALAFALEDGVPVVAVADPTNELVVENVRRALGVEPRLVVAAHGELAQKIQHSFAQARERVVESAPAPVAVPEAPAEAPVAVAEPAPAPAPAPMPTTVPPAEERASEPEPVAPAPVVSAPPPPTEVAPLHAEAAPEVPLAPEPVAPVAEPAPEVAAAAPAAEPVTPAPVAPPPAEQPQPPAEPVVIVSETPPAGPQQPVEPGLFAQAAEQALAPPVAAEPPPAAEPAPAPAAAPAPVEPTHLVALRLTGEDRVEIGAFGSQEEAESFARTVVGRISRAEGQVEWPLFGDRFIRPQTIVSVDVLERSGSSWSGSPTRARWAEAPGA